MIAYYFGRAVTVADDDTTSCPDCGAAFLYWQGAEHQRVCPSSPVPVVPARAAWRVLRGGRS